jgi:nucleoside-diphosphate-sugar epimerase
MKVLVTGATGFLGNYVIKKLLNYDLEIIATSLIQVKDVTKFEWHDKVKYVECNLNENKKDFFAFFERPDLLIHLAWSGLPNYQSLFHIEENFYSNFIFIDTMLKGGLSKISVTGTCLEYGMQNGCLKEDLETKPSNPYALAKDTLRKFLEELHKQYVFKFNWIRLFYMFGEGQNGNALISQLDRAIQNNEPVFNMSGGEQLRDYLPVDDVADYIVKISLQSKEYKIINCCSGIPISVRKFVEDYLKRKNAHIDLNFGYYPYPDYEPMAFWGDNTKLKTLKNG